MIQILKQHRRCVQIQEAVIVLFVFNIFSTFVCCHLMWIWYAFPAETLFLSQIKLLLGFFFSFLSSNTYSFASETGFTFRSLYKIVFLWCYLQCFSKATLCLNWILEKSLVSLYWPILSLRAHLRKMEEQSIINLYGCNISMIWSGHCITAS